MKTFGTIITPANQPQLQVGCLHRVDASAGNVTVELPSGIDYDGEQITVARIDTTGFGNCVQIFGFLWGATDPPATASFAVLQQPRTTVTLQCDNAGSWWPVSFWQQSGYQQYPLYVTE